MRAAVFLGHAQATGVTLVMLRSRSRDYANHHVTVDKHPHTGRVLRTVRLAFAANYLGRWVWQPATEAMLDAFCGENGRESTRNDTPSEGDRWLRAGSLVNLLGCEE